MKSLNQQYFYCSAKSNLRKNVSLLFLELIFIILYQRGFFCFRMEILFRGLIPIKRPKTMTMISVTKRLHKLDTTRHTLLQIYNPISSILIFNSFNLHVMQSVSLSTSFGQDQTRDYHARKLILCVNYGRI